MKLTTTLALTLLLSTTACSKDSDKKEEAPVSASKSAAAELTKSGENEATKVGLDTGGKSLGGDATRLPKLQFGGEGFDGEYNEALDSWHFEKWEPQADDTNDNVVSIYLDTFDSDWPKEMEAFATKLGESGFLDFGSKWTKVDTKAASDSGWVLTGEWSDGDDTEASLAVYSSTTNTLCRGTVKKTAKDQAASVKDAIAACQAAKL